MANLSAEMPAQSGMPAKPAAPARAYQVLRGRRPTSLSARAKLFPGQEWQVRVVNVSVGGVSCESETDAVVGSQIILHIEGLGHIPALVRWCSGGQFGARFNGRMDIPEKEMIAKLLGMSRKFPNGEAGGEEPASSTSASRKLIDGLAERPSWEFEIEQLHAYQLALLDRLENITAAPLCDQAELANLRLKLIRATRERHDLLHSRIFPDLQRASAKVTSMVERLRTKEEAVRRASAQHIGIWSMDAILSDWAGYCAASTTMRSLIRAQIAAEQEVIFLCRSRRS